jgi:hypothetical protein
MCVMGIASTRDFGRSGLKSGLGAPGMNQPDALATAVSFQRMSWRFIVGVGVRGSRRLSARNIAVKPVGPGEIYRGLSCCQLEQQL